MALLSSRVRPSAPGPATQVGVISLAEASTSGDLGPLPRSVSESAAATVETHLEPGEWVAVDDEGDLVLHLRSGSRVAARERLLHASRSLVAQPMASADGDVVVEAGVGVVNDGAGAQDLARDHARTSLAQRDLVPRPDVVNGRALRRWSRSSALATAAQVVVALLLTYLVPFLVLVAFYRSGLDVSRGVYLVLVAALAFMAALQWAEAIRAMAVPALPAPADGPAPAMSAVIAAYLPNESETIVETVETFLAQEYSGPVQVVLAYNTPRPLTVEVELAAMAERDPRLVLVQVQGSTSKAHNINAALPVLTGELVGIFDADHHPAAGSFERARRWLQSGVDIVQGHCVIRNGDQSWVARTVATEFEQVYAVSHPGRQRLHGFGVFGGSNGYWRAEVLRATRFRPDFLTEDIEASIRAVRDGATIVNDPGLVSRELAPTSLGTLWRQRMRWAQGWLQVAVRHVHAVVRPGVLGLRQRFGLAMLLVWREAFPWFSSLVLPLLAFFAWRDGGLGLGASVWWLTTLYTLTVGPTQILLARRLAVPEIRERTRWWWSYLLVSMLFFQEGKNLVARVAQLKQLVGEHHWVVTPRSTPAAQVSAVVEEVAA